MNIKMADVFNVPVAVTNGDEHKNSTLFEGVPLFYSGSYGINYRGIIGCVCFTELPESGTSPKFDALKAANYAAVAINSYDANQALIANQAEQIKMHKNQIAKIIMLYKQSNLISHTAVLASVELDELIASIKATKEQV